jgi:hypothetical protein
MRNSYYGFILSARNGYNGSPYRQGQRAHSAPHRRRDPQ